MKKGLRLGNHVELNDVRPFLRLKPDPDEKGLRFQCGAGGSQRSPGCCRPKPAPDEKGIATHFSRNFASGETLNPTPDEKGIATLSP